MAIEDQGGVAVGTVAPEASTGAPEAVQAPVDQSVAAPDADPNAALWKQLESIDPATLPKSIKDRLERPFVQDYTQKWQKLAEDKSRFMSAIAEKLGTQGAQPARDPLADLRERFQQGDYSEIDRFVEQAVQQKVGPIQAQVAQREAFEQAKQLHPFVAEKENEIADVLRSNPRIAQMATEGNFRNAPFVLQGIALSLENNLLKAQQAESKKGFDAAVKRGVEAELAKARGLPNSTTRVGTQTATPSKEYATMFEAAEAAWIASGGT